MVRIACWLAFIFAQLSTAIYSQPASLPNRVLELDGTNSCVLLPPNIFNELTEATVEGWVMWKSFGYWSRFFDFGTMANEMEVENRERSSDLVFVIKPKAPAPNQTLDVLGVLRTNSWVHISAVSGPQGMKLFLNGTLVASNNFTGSFSTIGTGATNYLGRSNYRGATAFDGDLHGFIDEVRVWRMARTEEQIRAFMFRRPDPQDPNLVGEWNFDSGDARDAGPGAYHGRLLGNARVVETPLSRREELAAFTRLAGRVLSPAGQPETDVDVRLFSDGKEIAVRRTGSDGAFHFAVAAPTRQVRLAAVKGEWGARAEVVLGSGGPVNQDLKLRSAVQLSGVTLAFDESPLPHVVLELVKPSSSAVSSDSFTVAGWALSDSDGRFRFVGVAPGEYRLRAHSARDFVYHSGTVLLEDVMTATNVAPPRVEMRMAPFKKGLRKWSERDGLAQNWVSMISFDPQGRVWFTAYQRRLSRFDGREFKNLTLSELGITNALVDAICGETNGVSAAFNQSQIVRFEELPENRWRATTYSTNHGLPVGGFRHLLRDHRGKLWVAMDKGVARLDGEGDPEQARFTLFTTTNGLPSNDAFRLHETQDGTLWVGTLEGAARLAGERFQAITVADGLAESGVFRISSDLDGTVWFMGSQAATRYDGRSFSGVQFDLSGIKSIVGLSGPNRAPNGDFWFGSDGGGAWRFNGKTWINYGGKDALTRPFAIEFDPEGHPWFGEWGGGVGRLDEHTMITFTRADGLPSDFVNDVKRAPDGTLYVSTGQGTLAREAMRPSGVLRLTERGFERLQGEGELPVEVPTRLQFGSNGDLWFGTLGAGLVHYNGTRFSVVRFPGGRNENFVKGLSLDANGIFWAACNNGLFRYDGDALKRFGASDGMVDNVPATVHADGLGRVWAPSDLAKGGLSLHDPAEPAPDGKMFGVFREKDGLTSDSIFHVVSDRTGRVLLGTFKGLTIYENGIFRAFNDLNSHLPTPTVSRIFEDSKGTLWIGMIAGSVVRYDGRSWSTIDKDDGLNCNLISSLEEDHDGSMWIGTDAGLTRYRPRKVMPIAPSIAYKADRLELNSVGEPRFLVDRRVTLAFSSADFYTVPARRQYRYQILDGIRSVTDVATISEWLGPVGEQPFDHVFDRVGRYTLAVRYMDRDLNYSPASLLHVEVVPPWYANAWIIVPGGAGIAGLLVWSLLARSLVLKRKRETQELREQLLSQERAARATLEIKNAQLESARRAAEEAKQMADTANAAKSQFLASMSHELRTPLNAIIGYSEIVQEELTDLGVNEVIPDLEKINAAARHQLGLVNDILDLSKIEAGKMTLFIEEFDVAK
ncbi:MAG: two-component regulator propeller domain-containing protein, partial [Verrucomicrobiota bacterium]